MEVGVVAAGRWGMALNRGTHVVAALVVIVDRVKRLMQVADEVHEELQRLPPLVVALRVIAQHLLGPGELGDDAIAFLGRGAVAGGIVIGRAVRNVDEVPVGRLGPFRADFVGPR
jgi:hypothetical protein